MLESYLEWGTQPIRLDHSKMDYGVSVTDPCIDWPTTESLLREAAERGADPSGLALERLLLRAQRGYAREVRPALADRLAAQGQDVQLVCRDMERVN